MTRSNALPLVELTYSASRGFRVTNVINELRVITATGCQAAHQEHQRPGNPVWNRPGSGHVGRWATSKAYSLEA